MVSTHDHPELLPLTAHWRWKGFFEAQHIDFQDVLRFEHERVAQREGLARTFVLFEAGNPVGMVTLAENDLETRPDLNPWLADLYVPEPSRGRGYGLRLVKGLEDRAKEMGINQLWLFTKDAAKLYRKAGWSVVETNELHGDTITIMSRAL